MRASVAAMRVPQIGDRKKKLRALLATVMARRPEIREAMRLDFGKRPSEVDLSEIYPVVREIKHALRRLDGWARPRKVATPLPLIGTRSEIRYEPKGVVLVIAPWNFPFNLTLGPLVSALAAGNRVIVKPSELASESSACIRRIVEETFDPNEVAVVEGGSTVAEDLVSRPFDHIFFTGSSRVGRKVMAAAAGNLTSVTLELGGKSPAIVDSSADLRDAAEKIVWGKFLNAGQTCIAPDYVLVQDAIRAGLVVELSQAVEKLFRVDGTASIVSEDHYRRLRRLYDEASQAGAVTVTGGRWSDESRWFASTVLSDVPATAKLLTEEIFGPILPVIGYGQIDDAIHYVRERPTPLALYVFSRDAQTTERVLLGTPAGGTCVNDVLVHYFHLEVPFGGAGTSGMGRAHGFFGFEAFSHARAVVRRGAGISLTRMLYPPYTRRVRALIDLAIRWL